MANALGTLFGNIANSIRHMTGEYGTMKPSEFPIKIRTIPVGVDPVEFDTALDKINGELVGEFIVAEGLCGTNVRYVLKDSGLLTITGTGEMTSAPWQDVDNWETLIEKVTIGDGITSVRYEAFASCEALTSVSLGNTVEKIEYAAFNGTSISRIVIPASVMNIHALAFSRCDSLTRAYFEDQVGWQAEKSTGEFIKAFTSADLSNEETAALYLSNYEEGYSRYEWVNK